MKLLDSIIWRDDSMSRFESAFGLQQRFCTLNRISANEFFDFASEVGAISKTRRAWNAGMDLARLNMARLGNILGEGRSLEVSNLHEYYPAIFPELGTKFRCVRYCPVCIQRGYHSAAHQVEWLDRCLIHGEKLVAVCSKCGIKLEFRNNGASIPLIRYCCSSCGDALWPGVREGTWPASLTAKELVPIADYIAWIAQWMASRRLIAIRHAADFAGQCDPVDRVDGLRSAFVKRPETTEMAWRPSLPRVPQRFQVRLGRKKSKILRCIAEISLRDLVDFAARPRLNMACITSIDKAAGYFARHIERQHKYCQHLILNMTKAAGTQTELDFLTSSLCIYCLGATHLRNGYRHWSPRTNLEPNRTLESERGNHALIRDRLRSEGLLRVVNRPVPHVSAVCGERCTHAIDVPNWALDEVLVQVVRFVVGEVLAAHLDWFFERCFEPDKIENIFQREEALRIAVSPDSFGPGVFLLPFSERNDLVILSFRDNTQGVQRSYLDEFDQAHKSAVARRARVVRWLHRHDQNIRFDNIRAAQSKIR